MSHGHRRQKRREAWRDDPNWEPTFNEPNLQRVYEETKPTFDAHRDRAVWADATDEKKGQST